MQYPTSKIAAVVAASLGALPALAQEDRDDEHHILEEIIVAATPLDRTVEQLAQPTSVLAGDALARKQATSIGETLAAEPGTTDGPVRP